MCLPTMTSQYSGCLSLKNSCIRRMVLLEGRHAVITFIDYSAAFDTESQLFLDSALADAGVSVKVRRIIQAIFAAATGVVRIRQPSGDNMLSDPFNIERDVLQGDIFSGMVVGEADSAILVSKFEYADDAALVDENAALASTRVTALATLPQRLTSQRSASLTSATRVDTRVHQAARTQSPRGSMVRRRSYATIATWHANRQSCENGQEASGRVGSRQGVCRQRGPRQRATF